MIRTVFTGSKNNSVRLQWAREENTPRGAGDYRLAVARARERRQ